MYCMSRKFTFIYLGKVKWEVQGKAFKHFILDWILQQAHVGEVDNRGLHLQIGIGLTVCWHVKQISSLVSRPCKGQGSDFGVVEMAPEATPTTVNTCCKKYSMYLFCCRPHHD